MKKSKLLFVAFLIALTSCSNEKVSNESSDIVGTWKMVDYLYSGVTVTEVQSQTLSTDFTGEAYDMNNTITFKENPNVMISEGSFSLKVTSVVLGQTTVQNISDLKSVSDGTWEMVNNELITESNGEVGKMKIDELTENSLVLSIKRQEDLSQAGATIISDIDAIVYFEKM
ncbi:lipocalin family protein [Tamlana sp. 2201CG12-4]|uniref:lipocalin family protein n=1 Tax=Tamlana sp. 2201CG12-4 TaxID=3112582 RepID=UPI002DB7B788|nr:lipocalin family protein [Tamlana sp. 2201CG12-4]MEC3908762.1 lipocalin family protein [Tamlana sp. 2201CG12-4]